MDSLHHHDDLEAVPPLPDQNEGVSSYAIENERPRSFFSRRKKAFAAVVGIVLVVAIAVGVAVSVGGSNPAEPDQAAGGVTQNNQDIVANAPSEESSTATATVAVDDSELQEPSANADSAAPQEEEEEEEAIDIDDESLDIILDVSHSAEYPDDLIYDEGYEQRDPEENEVINSEDALSIEKVEFNSEDMSVELAQFDGPITDFIVTPDLSRFSISATGVCPNPNESVWKMAFTTDNYPWEDLWQMVNGKGEVIAAGPPLGKNYARLTEYNGRMCIKSGRYTMKLSDKSGDGICCKYGNGKMEVSVDGKQVASTTDGEAFGEKEWSFVVTPSQDNTSTPQPTRRPSRKPTVTPTPKPNPSQGLNPNNNITVKVILVTDKFAKGETSYTFERVRNNNNGNNGNNAPLISKGKGSLLNEKRQVETVVVPAGNYKFRITDGFMGLENGGSYAVVVDGVEVMFGSTWNTKVSQTKEFIIKVGHTPEMTSRNVEWLNAHNTRREKYHEDNDKTFKPLAWSTELAAAAAQWVEEIIPTCKITREQGLAEGENISARSSNGMRDEGPDEIVARWSERKANQDYPENQSATQVYWRGTRYVGCADKTVTRENGTLCYVSVCRYLRPGNCSMQKFSDWKIPTLADRSACGQPCVNDECY